MLEAVKSHRLKVRVLFVLAAMVVAIMAASALSNSPSPLGTKEADAATAYRAIKGTVFLAVNGQSVPYAKTYLYRWSNGQWNQYKSGTANYYGQYYFGNNPTGYHYYVASTKWVCCDYHGQYQLYGVGASFYLRSDYSIPANSTVYLKYPVHSV